MYVLINLGAAKLSSPGLYHAILSSFNRLTGDDSVPVRSLVYPVALRLVFAARGFLEFIPSVSIRLSYSRRGIDCSFFACVRKPQ